MHAAFKRRPQYCVYRHSLDGEVFYIGSGLPMRPFETSNRNPAWISIATPRQDYTVEIIAWFDDLSSARALEKKEIKRFRPRANETFNPEWVRPRKPFFRVSDSSYHDDQYRTRMRRLGLLKDGKVSR